MNRNNKIVLMLLIMIHYSLLPLHAQRINGTSRGTTYLDYPNVSSFRNGVVQAQYYIDVDQLSDNRDYIINFRSTNQDFRVTVGGTVYSIPASAAQIKVESIVNNDDSRAQPILISRLQTPTSLTYFSTGVSTPFDRPQLIRFRTISANESNDNYFIFVTISGIPNLCVAGSPTSPGLVYDGGITYDLHAAQNSTSTTWFFRESEADVIRFRIIDDMEFSILNETVSLSANPSSNTEIIKEISNQFKISSNEPVELSVNAASSVLVGPNSATIPVSAFSIRVFATTNTIGNSINNSYQTISTSSTIIANTLSRFLDNYVGIGYRIGNPLVSLSNKPIGLYTVQLTFTVTQK